jgi:hypothetical protein
MQQQLLLRQQIHPSDTMIRGLMGLNTTDSTTSALVDRFHRSQQGLQLPSLQQPLLESFMTSNQSLRQHLARAHLNQDQQYQLLLEHHLQQQQQQHQRDRWNIDQSTSQSQFAQWTQRQAEAAIAAATNMPLLLSQRNRLNVDQLSNDPQPNWMRDQLSSIGFPSINRNEFIRAPQNQLVLPAIQPVHPTLNFDRTEELRQLLLANQRIEHNPLLHRMDGRPTAIGESLGGTSGILSQSIQSGMSWGRDDLYRGTGVGAVYLPTLLSKVEDAEKLSPHQVLLRKQIEAFQATSDDVSTHTRGRNKPIGLNQVGIRCRHCAHLPVAKRQKGSTYFPATILGIYQAAQNMSTTHIQSGLCSEMPTDLKQQFETLQNFKVASSGAGRPYWSESAKRLGLVDTEDGIQFIRSLRIGTRILLDNENKSDDDGRPN